MNLKNIVNTVAKTATTTMNRGMLKTRKHSPEILIVAGVCGVVASAVMACKATMKASEVIGEAKTNLDAIHECAEKPELADKYSEEDKKRDTTIVYVQTGIKMVKLYGPSIALGALSLSSIIMSNHILRKRNAALAAAYTAVDSSFKNYRKRVVEKFGEQVDKELKYGIKATEVEEKKADANGKETVVKKTIQTADGEEVFASPYARFFDESSPYWEKESEYNLMFLRAQQNWANDKLKSKGYLFLNEVYEALGLQQTKAGQCVGWTYNVGNPEGDNYVDFGIYDVHNSRARDFVNGYGRSILLDFNVDGVILDLI